jgi:hypothetical protein
VSVTPGESRPDLHAVDGDRPPPRTIGRLAVVLLVLVAIAAVALSVAITATTPPS